jgi:cytochrome c553
MKMSITRLAASLPAAALLLSVTGAAQAGEFDAAGFHGNSCMSCHGTEVYTRDDRRINSLPALEAQVARCDANLSTQLFPQDLDSLVEYLNNSYYNFDS